MNKYSSVVTLSLMIMQGFSASAHAQETSNAGASSQKGGLEDIVVTATRRETRVQDTPIAISAISGDDLKQRGITDPRQLSSLAPNLSVDQGIGNGQTHISIRGLASTSAALETSSPAAIYLDDVYQPFQFGVGTQIFDVNRIEVLRGPQGTLFGKNTTAGSVNYYSQMPTRRDEGYLTLDGSSGDFNRYSVEGAFNKVLTSDLAARFSFRAERRNAYIDNLLDGNKLGQYTNFNARFQLAWTPSDETKINLKIFGLRNRGDSPVYIARGYYTNPCDGTPDPVTGLSQFDNVGVYFQCTAPGSAANAAPLSSSSRKTYSDVNPQYEDYDNYGATLKIDQSFGDYTLTSISNLQKGHYHLAGNDDGMGGDFFHSQQNSVAWQGSQELRLATPVSAPLRAIFGLFGQHSDIKTVQGSISTNVPEPFQYTQITKADTINTTWAAFGSATYEFTKAVSLTGGLRYTSERVHAKDYGLIYNNNFSFDQFGNPIFNFRNINSNYFDFNYALSQFDPAFDVYVPFDGKKTFRKLTWDATLNVKPSDSSLLYAKVGTGFRSGGFFSEPLNSGLPPYVTLKPEKATAYEIGFKTEWLDRTLRINGDVYWTDYKDMQVQTYNPNGAGLIFSNAGTSRLKGAELEIEYTPVRGLIFSGSVGYNDAKYRSYDTVGGNGAPVSYAGNVLPYSAKWTGNAGISYETPVDETHKVSLNTSWSFRSRMYFEADNNPIKSDGPRAIGNARIGFGDIDDKWEIAAYVNNILNQDPRVFSYLLPSQAPTIYGPKRTFGGQLTFRF